MNGEWPDEVRSVVRLLIDGGASPSVVPISGGEGWVIYVSNARVTYDSGGWWNGGESTNGSDALAYLARVAGNRDPRHALQERIHAAVPGALVATTTDGIEVSVGSKSVRWKRERNGWSLGDDLFTSDERVIEHAKGMAADAAPKPAAPSLLERLRTAIPSLTWRQEGDECIGCDARGRWQAIVVHQIDLGKNQAHLVACKTETGTTTRSINGFDAVVQHIGRCLHGDGDELVTLPNHGSLGGVATGNATLSPAAPQPSPRAQALLDALRAQGYEPEYEQTASAEHVLCASEQAAMHSGEALWWYLGAQAGTEYVAEQMHLRITRSRLRAIDEAAKKRAPTNTITVNVRVLDTEALTRAIEEQSRREKAHAAKGPTMTTQDPEQRRRDEGVVMAELCRDVLRKHPNAVASACVVESERDWYYTLVLSEHFDDVEVQYENGRFYLYQRNATTAPSLTLEQARAVLLTSSTALIPVDDENTRTRTRRIPSKRAVIHDIERIAPYSQWIAERTKRNEGATTMTTQTKTEALAQTIKLDASEAAWRTAGSQFVKLAREPLVGLLTRHLAPNDDAFRARLAAFLETELGTALLASMLSATLSAMPQTTGEVPQKLARELRVKAMATAGDEIASVLSGPLLQVMRLYLQDPAGAPAAAPALDAPQAKSVEWATAEQKEGAR